MEQKDKHLFYSDNRDCEAKGFYHEGGFTVLKGSIIAKDTTPSFAWKEQRAKLIKELTIMQDDKLISNIDQTFSAPSSASDFCLGGNSNGWTIWKDKEDQTLDEA